MANAWFLFAKRHGAGTWVFVLAAIAVMVLVVPSQGRAQRAASCKSAAGKCTKDAQCCAGLVCQGGSCLAGCRIAGTFRARGASNPTNACQSCRPRVSTIAWTNRANGTTCSDGNACTQSDRCQTGLCVGSDPLVCTASDGCHLAGTCNSATGTCSNPSKPDGAVCNDGNACTRADTCLMGVCAGGDPVVCGATDQCHATGACDATTGVCSNPSKPDGAACNDASACTSNDVCTAGVCGGTRYSCMPANPCVAGTCNGDGTCTDVNVADGTPCSAPNASGTCGSGTCGISACTVDYADCDGERSNGCEVNLSADAAHCGACGTACLNGGSCSAGGCTCQPGYAGTTCQCRARIAAVNLDDVGTVSTLVDTSLNLILDCTSPLTEIRSTTWTYRNTVELADETVLVEEGDLCDPDRALPLAKCLPNEVVIAAGAFPGGTDLSISGVTTFGLADGSEQTITTASTLHFRTEPVFVDISGTFYQGSLQVRASVQNPNYAEAPTYLWSLVGSSESAPPLPSDVSSETLVMPGFEDGDFVTLGLDYADSLGVRLQVTKEFTFSSGHVLLSWSAATEGACLLQRASDPLSLALDPVSPPAGWSISNYAWTQLLPETPTPIVQCDRSLYDCGGDGFSSFLFVPPNALEACKTYQWAVAVTTARDAAPEDQTVTRLQSCVYEITGPPKGGTCQLVTGPEGCVAPTSNVQIECSGWVPSCAEGPTEFEYFVRRSSQAGVELLGEFESPSFSVVVGDVSEKLQVVVGDALGAVSDPIDVDVTVCASDSVPTPTPQPFDDASLQCPAGQFADSEASVCSPCPAGTYSGAGSSMCSLCAEGTIAPTIATAECAACPANATSDAIHTQCLCDVGYYGTTVDGAFTCVACPQGADCSQPGTTLETLTALPGWWR